MIECGEESKHWPLFDPFLAQYVPIRCEAQCSARSVIDILALIEAIIERIECQHSLHVKDRGRCYRK